MFSNSGPLTKFKCTKCNKEYTKERSLKMHNLMKQDCDKLYSCKKCNKVFDKKFKLTKHENRKTSCVLIKGDPTEPTKKNQCKFCYKLLSSKYNLNRHLDICKIKNTEKGMQLLNEVVKEKENEKLDEVQKENEELRKMMKTLMKDSEAQKATINKLIKSQNAVLATVKNSGIVQTAKTVQNANTINNNTVNITINNYNNPNIEGLFTPDKMLKMFQDYGNKVAGEMVSFIWFNPERPENHSIYLVNKKSGETLIYEDETWKSTQCKDVIPQVKNIVYKIMNDTTIPNFKKLNFTQRDSIECVKGRNRFTEYDNEDSERIKHKLISERNKIQKPKLKN